MVTTSRLFVRHLSLADYPSFAALESDPDVKKFSGGRCILSQGKYTRLVSNPSNTCLAVCAREDGRFVGRCGFRQFEDRVELEIFLVRTEQGHRLGSELFDAMIQYCATTFPTAKVAATVSTANSRAINLLEGHKFTDTGETVFTKAGCHCLYVRSI